MSSPRTKMDPAFGRLQAEYFSAYAALAERGVTLMGWADPFYPDPIIPAHVLEATRAALEAGRGHYTIPIGSPELRRCIARKLRRFNGIDADPETEIIVTPGSDLGLYYAIRPFIQAGRGDEVLNPDPSYPNNFVDVELMGGVNVAVPLREEKGFQIDVAEFERRVTDRTRLLILTHPNNPTTTVYSRENLEALSRFVIDHDLIVVTDQAFESSVFDDREFISIATLPGMWERTVSVFSISKDTGLSGFRVAYIAACAEIMEVLHAAAVFVLGATNTLAQYGAMAALEQPGFIQDFNRRYDRRRRFACELFNAVPGVRCLLPESSFMCWVNVAALGTSREIVDFLIEDARVAVNDGSRFGQHGEGYLRIILGSLSEESAFEDAVRRIAGSLHRRAREKGL